MVIEAMRGERETSPVCLAVNPYDFEKMSEEMAETRMGKSEAMPSA
jgi:flagellar biosynthesis/type III secretory pathway protein FliH